MRFYLSQNMFCERELLLAEYGDMKAYAFKYSTGVAAVRVENNIGSFTILPFQGQQIWRADFCGRNLVMKTGFDEPIMTKEYLKTYGGFLLHCGINAFGVPGKGDNHTQHGELPNAEYDVAYIDCGSDKDGNYMAIGGEYEYKAAFTKNYVFRPECRLYESGTILNVRIELENRRSYPMEYMYLCHINFNPVDGAELIYTAPYDGEHIKIYKSDVNTELLGYISRLERNITMHHSVGSDGECYDPEICFAVKYSSDENGRAYTMQYTDNGADFVSHPVNFLPFGIRWISRTADEAAMGMVLPATAEHLGYTHAKESGQIKILKPKEKISFMIQAGYLPSESASNMKDRISEIMKRR